MRISVVEGKDFMLQDSDSKLTTLKGKNNKALPPETTTNKDKPPLLGIIASNKQPPRLKLAVSNPAPVSGNTPVTSDPAPSNTGFNAEVRNIGTQIYEMNIQDPFHDLGCGLILEIEKSIEETVAVCHFPVILNESNKFLDEDEELYGAIILRFQMKVLEQLFMFCVNHDASRLTIYMDDAQAEGFGIYDDFLSHYDETLTENGEKTEMVISTDQKTFDKWLAFMAETNLNLEQELWREQRSNLAIRNYLKSRPLG